MTTPFLYDDGEESWPIKWHAGCGGVYLSGYFNVDIDGVSALDHPDMMAENLTTINDYYARLDGDMNHLPTRRPTVCDIFSDLSNPHGIPNTIDKIVAVQVFEHFTPAKAIRVLQAWHDDLKHGRPLVMSVPDTIGTLALMKSDHDFAMRHMLGRNGGSDKYQSHWAWYTQEQVTEPRCSCHPSPSIAHAA